MSARTLILGTRGSALALWQTRYVASLLREHDPELLVSIKIIKTTGDRILNSSLAEIGGKGVFTKELEDALSSGEIDAAIHSLKDLPTTLPEGLALGAILERTQAEDVFLSNADAAELFALPPGAVVATGSVRRKAQLLARRPDYGVADIRGNVPSRIEKLRRSTWSGMILARAGVTRLGLEHEIAHTIPLADMLPAPGQGAIAIEIVSEREEIRDHVKALHHQETAVCVTAERTALAALGGGCQLPLGTYARIEGDALKLDACIARLDGKDLVRISTSGKPDKPEAVGTSAAEELLGKGGFAILESLNVQTDFNTIIRTM